MMDMFDLASRLFGTSRAESIGGVSNGVDTIIATGATDSDSGAAGIVFDADVTPPDDYDGDETIIEIPTSPTVAAGDDVMVSLSGDGPLKVPMVIANPGSGDRMQTAIDSAASLASAAQAVAEATGQHFWDDANGAHVTQVTRDEWEDSSDPNYHSGPNSLWNSLGMLFRDGLTNLLAILTNGIAIYDGLGNNADNIVASFDADEVRIGGAIPDDGSATALVRFFDSDDDKGATLDGFVQNDYTPTSDDGWGVQVQDTYTKLHTRTHDADMTIVNGGIGESQLQLGQSLYWEDGPDTYSTVESTAILTAVAESGLNPGQTARAEASIGVKATTLDDDTEHAYVVVGGVDIPLTQAIIGLVNPEKSYTGTSGTTTASSTGWRLTYFNTNLSTSGGAVWNEYLTFSNGVITAVKECRIEVSGVMNWNDTLSGQRGFGLFLGGTVGSGAEYSSFMHQRSSSSSATRVSVYFPPRLFHLTAGQKLAVGRYEPNSAIYQDGNNFSWITIRLVNDGS